MESMHISEGEDKPSAKQGDYTGRGNSSLLFKRVQKRWRAYLGIRSHIWVGGKPTWDVIGDDALQFSENVP